MNEELNLTTENYSNQKKRKKHRHRRQETNNSSCVESNLDAENIVKEISNQNNFVECNPLQAIVNESTENSINNNEIKRENLCIVTSENKTAIKNYFNQLIDENNKESNFSIDVQIDKSQENEKSNENIEQNELKANNLESIKISNPQKIIHRKIKKKKVRNQHNKIANSVVSQIDYLERPASNPLFLNSDLFQPETENEEYLDGSNQNLLQSQNSFSLLSLNDRNSNWFDQKITNSVENVDSSAVDQLEKDLLQLVPNKTAKIMVLTWNMAEKTVFSENSFEFIHNINYKEKCDLFLFCFQETSINRSELLTRIQSAVGLNYVIYDEIENKKIYVVLVGHKKFIWNIGAISKKVVSTRITTITKGVAAISFYFFGTSILFMGSHLSSDLGKNDLRLEDYKLILNSKDLIESLTMYSNRISCGSINISDYFDYTFWAGDFNFRLNLDDVKVRRIINQENNKSIKIENLLEHDELINGQIESLIFQDFQEGRIGFMPTYKFDINSNEYNKNRPPAYTDRILFKSLSEQAMDYLCYSSVESVVASDHKPVYAIIEIQIEKQSDEYLKSSGKFNNEIYDKCFKVDRPIRPLKETVQSKTCSIQ